MSQMSTGKMSRLGPILSKIQSHEFQEAFGVIYWFLHRAIMKKEEEEAAADLLLMSNPGKNGGGCRMENGHGAIPKFGPNVVEEEAPGPIFTR